MRSLRVVAGALVLAATLVLAAFAVFMLLEGNEVRAGGAFILVLVVPPGVLWSWLLLSRPRR